MFVLIIFCPPPAKMYRVCISKTGRRCIFIWHYLICYIQCICFFYLQKMPKEEKKTHFLCETFCLSRIASLALFLFVHDDSSTLLWADGHVYIYRGFAEIMCECSVRGRLEVRRMTSSEDWRGKKCQFAWRTWSNAAPLKDVMRDIWGSVLERNHRFRLCTLRSHVGFCPSALLLLCGRWKYWILSLCFAVCWLNWTANQSCFSSLALLFRRATERGRRHECRPQKACLLQISVQKWSKKTRRNVSNKGSKQSQMSEMFCCLLLLILLRAAAASEFTGLAWWTE